MTPKQEERLAWIIFPLAVIGMVFIVWVFVELLA